MASYCGVDMKNWELTWIIISSKLEFLWSDDVIFTPESICLQVYETQS